MEGHRVRGLSLVNESVSVFVSPGTRAVLGCATDGATRRWCPGAVVAVVTVVTLVTVDHGDHGDHGDSGDDGVDDSGDDGDDHGSLLLLPRMRLCRPFQETLPRIG